MFLINNFKLQKKKKAKIEENFYFSPNYEIQALRKRNVLTILIAK
jgi:hypothetical protein